MNTLEDILSCLNLHHNYPRLTDREKNILTLYYLKGYTDIEIARRLGICQQNVNRQRRRGISKLRKLRKEGLKKD